MSEALDRDVDLDFVSLGTMWLSNKKYIIEKHVLFSCPMGALEIEELLMFLGPNVEGWSLLL